MTQNQLLLSPLEKKIEQDYQLLMNSIHISLANLQNGNSLTLFEIDRISNQLDSFLISVSKIRSIDSSSVQLKKSLKSPSGLLNLCNFLRKLLYSNIYPIPQNLYPTFVKWRQAPIITAPNQLYSNMSSVVKDISGVVPLPVNDIIFSKELANGARGLYSSSKGRVYLASNLTPPELISTYFHEEAGHHADNFLSSDKYSSFDECLAFTAELCGGIILVQRGWIKIGADIYQNQVNELNLFINNLRAGVSSFSDYDDLWKKLTNYSDSYLSRFVDHHIAALLFAILIPEFNFDPSKLYAFLKSSPDEIKNHFNFVIKNKNPYSLALSNLEEFSKKSEEFVPKTLPGNSTNNDSLLDSFYQPSASEIKLDPDRFSLSKKTIKPTKSLINKLLSNAISDLDFSLNAPFWKYQKSQNDIIGSNPYFKLNIDKDSIKLQHRYRNADSFDVIYSNNSLRLVQNSPISQIGYSVYQQEIFVGCESYIYLYRSKGNKRKIIGKKKIDLDPQVITKFAESVKKISAKAKFECRD